MTSGGQAAPVTLGYPEIGHQLRESRYMVLHAGADRSPTEAPQLRDTVADPHRIPHGLNGRTPVHLLGVLKARRTAASSVDACELAVGAFSRLVLSE